MADAFIVRRGGGGGASLNFSVVGGTTQPTGKENLIWVNTANTITSWEFSATQPTSPVAGMVWFRTILSASVKFNALKKNGVWVYPSTVSQYVGGTWVSKNASIYQSGSWKPFFDGRIFDNGLVNNITFSKTTTNGILTIDSVIDANNNATWSNVWFFSDQPIDVTSYQIMRVTYGYYGYILGDSAFGLATTRGTTLSSYKKVYDGVYNTEVTIDINIASAVGEYYFGGSAYSSGNGSSRLTIKSILLIS